MLVYGKYEHFVMKILYVVSCVHPVTVLNTAFCMTCSLLMMTRQNSLCLHQNTNRVYIMI